MDSKVKRIAFCLATFVAVHTQAAEVIPPKPPGYFQDNAGVVSQSAALRFNEQLAQFERDTSNQVVDCSSSSGKQRLVSDQDAPDATACIEIGDKPQVKVTVAGHHFCAEPK